MTTPHYSLFLSEKQHGLKDSVYVNFQQSVELVHLHFDLLRNLLGLFEHPGVAVDHDGVCVSINHV